jgi:hypothetical protein
MIHALRYEPQGQRQRYKPHEQQNQERHIHLHFHLNLTFRASRERSTHPDATRIIRIFAALVAATVMPLGIFIFALIIHDDPPGPTISLSNIAWISLFAGLALAWCAVGALFLDIWRSKPRGRFGLFLLATLLLSIPFFLLHGFWFGAILAPIGIIHPLLLLFPLIFLLLFVHPLITALLLMYVSREARALCHAAPAHTRLSFVVVSGMCLRCSVDSS